MLSVVQHVQDEVEFVVSNFEFALEPGQAVANYVHHRKVLFILLTLTLCYEVALIVYLAVNRDFMLAQLVEIYRNFGNENVKSAFYWSFLVDFVIGSFTYGTGFWALKTHKVKLFNVFGNFLLISVFSKILLSYLNV